MEGASNPTCTLRCTVFPEVSTTLTCAGGAKLEGDPPESKCGWVRDEEEVQTEGGKVTGLRRPMVWHWDLRQYGDDRTHTDVEFVRTYWGIPFGAKTERFKAPRPA